MYLNFWYMCLTNHILLVQWPQMAAILDSTFFLIPLESKNIILFLISLFFACVFVGWLVCLRQGLYIALAVLELIL